MEDFNNGTKNIIIYPSEINGRIDIMGAKNSTLKLQVASILSDSKVILSNFPKNMSDVNIQTDMLKVLGKDIYREGNTIQISGKVNNSSLLWNERSIRNTLLVLGALLTKTGYGKVPLPGGCPLGERKYDIHIDLMESMGAAVWEEDGYLCAKKTSRKLKSIDYTLPIRSTGATENAILMACLADGTSRIWNPHIRPEIMDLISLLNKMGAKIRVYGQESILVEGVDKLDIPVNHNILSDNMQALTYLIAGAISGNELYIRNFPFADLEIPLTFLKFSGLRYFQDKDELIVRKCKQYPIDISTGPYPGINSDMQPLFAVWGALAKGTSSIVDLRFTGRYRYSSEMVKMGIDSVIEGNKLIIKGGNSIKGCDVTALDLRAGAALLLLALVADSPTKIEDFWMVERGYDDVISTLKSIGVRFI